MKKMAFFKHYKTKSDHNIHQDARTKLYHLNLLGGAYPKSPSKTYVAICKFINIEKEMMQPPCQP